MKTHDLMKQASCWAAAFSLLFAFSISSAAADPAIGKPAPGFAGEGSDGKTYRLEAFPYVGKHYGTGNMQELQKQAAADEIVWLSVISSAPGKQGHVMKEEANALTRSRDAAPSAIILDSSGEIGRAYAATATPHMFVINSDGILVYKGAIDDRPTSNFDDVKGATNYVRMAIQALADGKPVSKAATRAYGCSIKYGS
jgi:hypothetical protein